MNQLSEPLGLRSPDGREAQLLSVQVHGEVLGLMLRLTVRQTWRNTSGAPMATRLAFALSADQCLLELQAERSHGAQAITALSRESLEVCSAGFGVMHTGEQVTLQWRVAQLLDLQGGSLRLQIPAAMVPRALQPARLSMEVHDPVARGTLGGSSHELQKVRHANGMTFKLMAPHGLERDLSLNLHGLRDTGFALASPDLSQSGYCTVLASHYLHLNNLPTTQRLRLKLLVDHSGAIGSERQSQVQVALERLLGRLQPGDQLSYSRVGAQLLHDLPRLQPCTEAYVRRACSLMRHTEVAPGEPDWLSTLQSLIDLPDEDEEAVHDASILLVTAHPITSMANALQALRRKGHRLYVMAVGVPASESLWPVLARASGGRCEVLGSSQQVHQTLQRLVDRMRSLHPVEARMSISGQPLSTAQHDHSSMAEGDTLHLWACVEPPQAQVDLAGRPEWHVDLQWQDKDSGNRIQTAANLPVLWDAKGDLTRLCASREVLLMSASPERDALIERHRLLVPNESRMVFRSVPVPEQQLAAPTATPHPARGRPGPHTTVTVNPCSEGTRMRQLRTASAHPARITHPVAGLVHQFNLQASGYKQFRAALSATLQRSQTRTVDGLVMVLARQAGNPGRVWALLLHFLHAEHELVLQDHALQLVEQELASVPMALRNEVNAALAAASITQPARQAA